MAVNYIPDGYHTKRAASVLFSPLPLRERVAEGRERGGPEPIAMNRQSCIR